nr:hypothetical protein [Tanacetum cinerariifolium]
MTTIDSMKFVLTQSALDVLCEKFHIPDVVHPELPGRNDRIRNSHLGAGNDDVNEEGDGAMEADQTQQGGHVVHVGGIDIIADDETPAIVIHKPKRLRNKRKATDGASGSGLPPNKLKEDHGVSGDAGASTVGKYLVVLQGLLDSSTLATKIDATAAGTILFVNSFVTPTLEREGGGHVDSITGSSMPPPSVLTVEVATTIIADVTSAPAPRANTGLRLEHELRGRKKFEDKFSMQAGWLKEEDADIASLKALLSLKEAEAAEEIYLHGQVAVIEAAEAARVLRSEELAEYINTLSWNRPAFYNYNDDDEDYTIAITPVLPTEEPDNSLSMGYEHLNTTSKTESNKIIKSGVEELVPILSENKVTLEDKRECDMFVCENSPIFDDHSEILSDSTDDDNSSDDAAFEDIEYVEASLPDPDIISLEEENDVYVEDEESPALIPIFEESDNSLSNNSSPEFETFSDQTKETRSGSTTTHDSLLEYDSFCFEIDPDQERLTSVFMKDISDDSINDLLLEEVDLFLASDNSIPSGIENFGYDLEGDIRFLKELLIDDSITFPINESFDFEDDPSFPRPPPEPPDAEFDFEPDAREEILVVRNYNDELIDDERFDTGGEIDVSKNIKDDDYFPFMFVIQNFLPYFIYPEVFPLLLSAESEDTIFDPGISV